MKRIELKGKKYYLKTLLSSDVNQTYFDWICDPEVNKFLEVRLNLPKKLDDLIDYVKTYNNDTSYIWGIYSTQNDQYLGNFAIHVNKYHGVADFGYFVGEKSAWGSSAGLNACALAFDFAFDTLGLRKLWGGVYHKNIGSLFNYKRLGAVQEAKLRKQPAPVR